MLQDITSSLLGGLFFYFFSFAFIVNSNIGRGALYTGSSKTQRLIYVVVSTLVAAFLGTLDINYRQAAAAIYAFGFIYFGFIEDGFVTTICMATGGGLIFFFVGIFAIAKGLTS